MIGFSCDYDYSHGPWDGRALAVAVAVIAMALVAIIMAVTHLSLRGLTLHTLTTRRGAVT